MICCVTSSVFVIRPRMVQDQPSMLPSPGSMKLSSVTKLLAIRWKFGVIRRPNCVSDGSPFAPLVRSPRIWSKVRFSFTT